LGKARLSGLLLLSEVKILADDYGSDADLKVTDIDIGVDKSAAGELVALKTSRQLWALPTGNGIQFEIREFDGRHHRCNAIAHFVSLLLRVGFRKHSDLPLAQTTRSDGSSTLSARFPAISLLSNGVFTGVFLVFTIPLGGNLALSQVFKALKMRCF
jgi:hypothetical protein